MNVMDNYNHNRKKLLSSIENYTDNDCMIAFSGGVDSSLLLKLACELAKMKNTKVYAVTIHTQLHPMNDLSIAQKVAEEAGAIHSVIQVDELQDAGILNNPFNRCYLCKKYLFSRLKQLAKELHINNILDGTNEDDLHVYRPGIQALRELNIISPLADAKMTKNDVRQMAKELEISVAERPSAPCLATRFPYGTSLSYEKMTAVEKGEDYIRALGFYNVRLRVHDDMVRIEVDENDIDKLIHHKNEVLSFLKDLGFIYITIDLEGFRSGSMDYKVI
jgi:pyridinium-3,5-biscarboxylic acid mononucleotide sulfurtransferase